MPRVQCIDLPGVKLIFHSNDHTPPHFHAERPGEWHYKVSFLLDRADMLEKVSGPRSIHGGTRRDLLNLTVEHRMDLYREWEATRSDD